MVQRGRPLQEVNDFLGQQSIVVTLRHAHLAPENLRTAASSLDDVPLSTPAAHEPVASEIPPKKLEVLPDVLPAR